MNTVRWRCAALAVVAAAVLPLNAVVATTAQAVAPVSVSGRVFTPEGAAAGGVRVNLSRDIGVASTVGGLLGTIFSFGLACIYHDVKLCQNNSYPTTTRPDGTFGIGLPGEVGSVALTEHNKFDFSVSLPPGPGETSGPSASATFNVTQAQIVIPDVHLWRAAVKVTGDKLHGHISFAPTNPPVSAYGVTFSGPGGGPVYTTTTNGPAADFDARLLEDAQGSASATASAAAVGASGITLSYHSPGSAFSGTAGAPPSRGKACSYQQGDRAAVPISPCVLTDGDFARPFQVSLSGCAPLAVGAPQAGGAPCSPPPATPCLASPLPARPTQQDLDRQRQAQADCARQRQGSVIIDMGATSQSIGMVVVRGGGGNLSLDTSNDGHTWTSSGTTATGTPSATTLPAGVHARYVRLFSSSGVPSPAEVSIWPSLLPDPGPLGLGGLFGSSGQGGLHLPQPTSPGGLLALLLIAAVVAGGAGAGAYFGIKAVFGPRSGAPPPSPPAG